MRVATVAAEGRPRIAEAASYAQADRQADGLVQWLDLGIYRLIRRERRLEEGGRRAAGATPPFRTAYSNRSPPGGSRRRWTGERRPVSELGALQLRQARTKTSQIMSGSCWLPDEPDHLAAGRPLDDLLEAVADRWKHALADDVVRGPLRAASAPPRVQADDEVVADVGLGARAAAVVVLQSATRPSEISVRTSGGGDGSFAAQCGTCRLRVYAERRRGQPRPGSFAVFCLLAAWPQDVEGVRDGDPQADAPVPDDVLEAVNAAMVALHARYHGREPVTARTRMMGEDMLAVMLGDPYTDVEKTMIELQRQALVHETRSTFQQAMEHRSIAAVERLRVHLGRHNGRRPATGRGLEVWAWWF